jgi:hypothetical protein
LTWIDEYAKDAQGDPESGILGKEEAQLMRGEIQRVLVKMANLSHKERNKSLNKELKVLAKWVMRIWA